MSLNGPLNFLVNLAFIFIILLMSSCGQKNSSSSDVGQKSGLVIVDDLDWRDIEDIANEAVSRNARAVAYIDLPAMQSRCTGFLISDELLMTNHHCIPTAADATGVKAYFDYHKQSGKSQATEVRCDEFVMNDERLDFAILRCQGKPGLRFGKIKLATSTQTTGEGVYVIHQNCDYYTSRSCDWFKKYSQSKITELADEIGHTADTLGGSSGSPLFSLTTHQLIGLHHVGIGNNGMGRGRMNYAVKVSEIAEFISTGHPQVWKQLQPTGRTPATTEEPNNSIASAFSVVFGQSYEFSVGQSGDVDYFSFTVTERKTVLIDLNFKNIVGDLELKLYRKTGTLVASSTGSSDQEQISRILSPGTYVIKVYGYRNATGIYQLKLK